MLKTALNDKLPAFLAFLLDYTVKGRIFSMKITLVISALNAGGAERVITTLANAWAKEGENVSLITFKEPGYQSFYPLHPNVNLCNLNLRVKKRLYCPNFLIPLWKLLKRTWFLRQFFKKQKPDCIIAFLDTVNITTILATLGLKIPIIVSERVDPSQHPIGSLQNFLRKVTYPLANHLVVQTTQIQNYFPKKLHQRISIIPNPVSLSSHGSQLPNIDYEKKKIIAVGRLETQKGFDLLLQAFGVVHDKQPERDLVIWAEGSERPVLEALRSHLKLEAYVHLPGLTNNIAQVLSDGSLFVLPSRYEGFPNSLCEAMAVGLPVVAFDCGSGSADIIRHNIDGLLVPAQNVNALTNAMLQLIENIELRKQYGKRAKEIIERFSLKKILKKWDELTHC
ncbi:MAG: glycosyltransferase family 4 protein [Gammaproteobacteria bacterium]|nr:glycosyltransferase family 4 protein [Gammaproteobacteria bacterium]